VKRATFRIYGLAVLGIFAILAPNGHGANISASENRETAKASPPQCQWTADAKVSLDSTYRWHGLYLGGVERSITVIVKDTAISVQEKNARAIDGLDYKLQLTDGKLDTSREADGILSMLGTTLAGDITTQDGTTPINSGNWLFETTDCGKTFRLVWSERDGGISGEYVFGPTGYEWQHGANMASTAIYQD